MTLGGPRKPVLLGLTPELLIQELLRFSLLSSRNGECEVDRDQASLPEENRKFVVGF